MDDNVGGFQFEAITDHVELSTFVQARFQHPAGTQRIFVE